jgi:hypothetical protein
MTHEKPPWLGELGSGCLNVGRRWTVRKIIAADGDVNAQMLAYQMVTVKLSRLERTARGRLGPRKASGEVQVRSSTRSGADESYAILGRPLRGALTRLPASPLSRADALTRSRRTALLRGHAGASHWASPAPGRAPATGPRCTGLPAALPSQPKPLVKHGLAATLVACRPLSGRFSHRLRSRALAGRGPAALEGWAAASAAGQCVLLPP